MQDAFHLPAQVGQMPLHAGGIIPGDDLLPDDWDKDLLEGMAPSGNARPAPAPPPPPVVRAPPPAKAPPAEPVVTLAPASPPPPRQEPEAVADDGALLAAFLEGVGLHDARPKDPPATMLALGKAFRNLVAGLRAVLIARAQIKSEFRIEQTMIQAHGNNPLKFSAGDDDALAALLGTGRRTDMAPHEAVADALRDIRLHELASIAAMQSAVRTLLDGLAPVKLRAQVEQGGGMSLLPAQKKARAWDAYETLHARTVQALADDFDSVFGKAFARAYERSLQEISAKKSPMIRRRFLLPLLAALVLANCGGPKPKPPPVLTLTMIGSAEQNPDADGKAQPVAVRVYQLTQTAKFERVRRVRAD